MVIGAARVPVITGRSRSKWEFTSEVRPENTSSCNQQNKNTLKAQCQESERFSLKFGFA